MSSGIYCILNLANGSRYIGQSTDLSRRKSYHFTALAKGVHKNKHLQSAYNHHGSQAFRWSVLQYAVGQSCLDALERHWIGLYASNDPKHGYNAEAGGLTRPRASYATRLRMQRAQGVRHNRLVRDKRESPDLGTPTYTHN